MSDHKASQSGKEKSVKEHVIAASYTPNKPKELKRIVKADHDAGKATKS